MSTLGEQVAVEALSWVGTPFVWGQSAKGQGCDCKGLIAGVARDLGLGEAHSLYALYGGYRVDKPVPAAFLLEGMQFVFDRVQPTAMEAGDVLLCRYNNVPAHLAVYLGDGRVVHAYPAQHSQVQTRDLAVLLHKYPLHSVWRWRAR